MSVLVNGAREDREVDLAVVITASAALSPTYWWFVAIFALSRPLLTATDTIAGVAAAEQTGSADRAKAVALWHLFERTHY